MCIFPPRPPPIARPHPTHMPMLMPHTTHRHRDRQPSNESTSRPNRMAGPNPTAPPPPPPPLEPAAAAAAALGAQQQQEAEAAAGATGVGMASSSKAWERLLAGAGDDLLTCVFEFLQVAELATA